MNAICRNRTKRGRGHNEMILQLYWFTAARKKTATCLYRLLFDLEVPPGFGPGNEGFADLCLTTWLWHRINGAVDETRTRDLHLGKVALYQLSYYRMVPWGGIEPPTL